MRPTPLPRQSAFGAGVGKKRRVQIPEHQHLLLERTPRNEGGTARPARALEVRAGHWVNGRRTDEPWFLDQQLRHEEHDLGRIDACR